MPVRNEPWPDGTPNWVDLGVDDVEAAKSFYTSLFGWEYWEGGEEAGGYLLAQIDGAAVGGIGPKQDSNVPTVWTTFFAADDVDAVAAKIGEAGGTVIAPVMDVMTSGRMLIGMDTVGAAFGVWQAGDHIGAGRYNEHGALCWNELHTRDYQQARDFYASVFGFTYGDLDGEGFTYSTFKRASDGEDVGGVHHDEQIPEGVSNYWLTWFASNDVDATTAKAEELGSTIVVPVMDSPFGRMSIVMAPQGEVFGLITLPAA